MSINLNGFWQSWGVVSGNTAATNEYEFWKGMVMSNGQVLNNQFDFFTYHNTTRYEWFKALQGTYPDVWDEYTFYKNTNDPRIFDFKTFYQYGGSYLVSTPVTPTPTPIPPTPTPSPSPTGDTDATAYLAAVVSAGGTINSTITSAVNTLFTSLKSASLYTKLKVFYPMIGGVYNSIRIEAKLQTSYYLTQGGSWTYNSNGATTTSNTFHSSYLDTGYNPSTNLTRANTSYSHYWVNSYSMTPANDRYFAGAYSGGNNMWATNPYDSSNWQYVAYVNGDRLSVFNPSTTGSAGGMFISSQYSSSGTDYNSGWINTVASSVLTMAGAGNLPNANFYFGNLSLNNSPYQGIPGTYSFGHIGESLTNTDMSNLATIVNTFQTTLGRNAY